MSQATNHFKLFTIAMISAMPMLGHATGLAYDAVTLTVAGATSVQSLGLNDDGIVVGVAALPDANTGANVDHAVLWTQGQATDLGPGRANAVNAAGHIAGTSLDGNGQPQATLWIAQTPTVLGTGAAYALNGNDEVVGEAVGTDGLTHPAVWRQGVLKLLSTQAGRATGINASGQIVGYITSDNNGTTSYTAIRWVQDVPTTLSANAKANGINDAGVVVGQPTSGYYASQPYYWTADNQPHTVNSQNVYMALTAINDDGESVGTSMGAAIIGQVSNPYFFAAGSNYVRYPTSPAYASDGLINYYPGSVNSAGDIAGSYCSTAGACTATVLKYVGPAACTVSYGFTPISSTAFGGTVALTNLTQGDLVNWQVNETLKDATIVYRVSQAKIKVSNYGKLLTATPATANQTITGGGAWTYTFGAAKFPATVPTLTGLSATMGDQTCLRIN